MPNSTRTPTKTGTCDTIYKYNEEKDWHIRQKENCRFDEDGKCRRPIEQYGDDPVEICKTCRENPHLAEAWCRRHDTIYTWLHEAVRDFPTQREAFTDSLRASRKSAQTASSRVRESLTELVVWRNFVRARKRLHPEFAGVKTKKTSETFKISPTWKGDCTGFKRQPPKPKKSRSRDSAKGKLASSRGRITKKSRSRKSRSSDTLELSSNAGSENDSVQNADEPCGKPIRLYGGNTVRLCYDCETSPGKLRKWCEKNPHPITWGHVFCSVYDDYLVRPIKRFGERNAPFPEIVTGYKRLYHPEYFKTPQPESTQVKSEEFSKFFEYLDCHQAGLKTTKSDKHSIPFLLNVEGPVTNEQPFSIENSAFDRSLLSDRVFSDELSSNCPSPYAESTDSDLSGIAWSEDGDPSWDHVLTHIENIQFDPEPQLSDSDQSLDGL